MIAILVFVCTIGVEPTRCGPIRAPMTPGGTLADCTRVEAALRNHLLAQGFSVVAYSCKQEEPL